MIYTFFQDLNFLFILGKTISLSLPLIVCHRSPLFAIFFANKPKLTAKQLLNLNFVQRTMNYGKKIIYIFTNLIINLSKKKYFSGTFHGLPFHSYFSDSQCVTENPAYVGRGFCCQSDNCNKKKGGKWLDSLIWS